MEFNMTLMYIRSYISAIDKIKNYEKPKYVFEVII